jgi:curli biogenesis system outer membrane secretion channel CsgG
MKKIVLFSLFCFTACLLAIPANAAKKRIAVVDLEDKSAGQHSGWHNVGSGMADMITTALTKSGKYMVLERAKLKKIFDEQSLGASGAVTEKSAAKIGQLIGVQYLVTGSVTEFGVKESKLGVGNLGRVLKIGGGLNTKTNTARVVMDIRLIDTTTGEVIIAEKGEGEDSSTGVDIDLSAAPSVDFGKEGFDETVVGKAVRKSVDQVVKYINGAEAKAGWSAKIIKIEGKQIWINSGEDEGIKVGKTVSVYKKGEDLEDPDSGVSLGSTETKVGTAKITKVEKKYSIAETSTPVTKECYLKEEK